MKSILYLDMDGVLADFEGTCQRLFGDEWHQEIDKPEWGRVGECKDLYEILMPFPDAKDLYDACVEFMGDKNRVQILTALPTRAAKSIPDAALHKTRWAREHIDPNIRVHFGPLAQQKQLHVRHEHDILIDDMIRNIDQWRDAGGIGIHYLGLKETLRNFVWISGFIEDNKWLDK